MRSVIRAFVSHTVFANLVLVIFIICGYMAMNNMIRELFPEIVVETVFVEIAYPGADPEEVEEGISRKIEEGIDKIEGIKRYTTVSSENFGRAIIEIEEGYDVATAYDRIRNAVDSISTFPVDAEKPVISQLEFTREVIFLALGGKLNERTLKEWAEEIKDELQLLPEISQVDVLGAREYEIAIEVSEERLREYGLTFSQVAQAVRRGSVNLAGGLIRTQGEEIRLRTIGRKYRGDEFAKIVLLAKPNGDIITLGRVATIRDGFTEDPVYATFNGDPCVLLQVSNTNEEDAIAIAQAARRYALEKQSALPPGVHINVWGDRSKLIQDRINLLTRNGLQGLTIVFVLLWLFLDLRLSLWVVAGIPIAIAGALALMATQGITLNMISLFGLIMVLGIIVDDAIVVAEAIYVHRKSGDPPIEAAVNGVVEVGLPVIASVTTNMIAFMPLLFVSGILGKFIAILPVVVICAFTLSLIESLFTLPAHLSHLPDPNRDIAVGHPWKQRAQRFRRGISNGMEYVAEHVYKPFVSFSIRWRYITFCVAVTLLLLCAGLFEAGFLKFVLFPKLDGNDLIADVEFPQGTPIDVTRDAVARTEEAFKRVAANTRTASGEPLIKNIYAVVGQGGDEFDRRSGPHLGQVHVELLDTEFRGVYVDDLNVAWEKEVGSIPGALRQTFAVPSGGPPGAPIEIWLQGESMEVLLAAAEEVKEKLRSYEGVYQVADDYRPGKNELQMDIKPEARTLGLTLDDLSRQVYAGYFGEEAVRLQRGRDDIRVRVRYPAQERKTLSELEQVRIRTPLGKEVPLYSVADVRYGKGYSSITRVNGLRRVAVTAEVDTKKANAEEIIRNLSEGEEGAPAFMPQLARKYTGLIYAFEGAKKDGNDAFGSLRYGFPVALFIIFMIIAIMFRSYVQPFLIMVTVPFGLVGALIGHLVLGYDVTIMSTFGMVAMSGVVVNDAIVMIECINSYVAKGLPFFHALASAGARRFRAVFLTTATTVGGLSPLILEKNLQAKFLIPMAISMAGGVLFATVLTLVFIPCMYGVLNDLRRVAHYLRYRTWPTPEEVEPVRRRIKELEDEAVGGAPQSVVIAK